MTGPAAGLVVVDASWGMPGAVASMLFADYGAEVIKVERPGGGPDSGSLTRLAWERGKSSIEVDLSSPAGHDTLLALLEGADVFIESYGPGRAAGLGLGYDELHDRLPGLVYCAITGYGQEGPWADRPGYDFLVAARLGLLSGMTPEVPPAFLGHPSVGYGTGLLAAIGTFAALRARRQTGRGQLVDVSMLDSVMGQSLMNWWWNERDIYYLKRTGTEPGLGRTRLLTGRFQCEDDEWLFMHTGGEGAFKRTMDIIGLGELVRVVPAPEMAAPLDDQEKQAVSEAGDAFKTRPRAEWLKLLHDADIAAMPILRSGEILSDDQVEFAGLVVELPDSGLGVLRQVGPASMFSESVPSVPTAAPKVGAQNSDVEGLVARVSSRPAPAGRGAQLTQPLEGVRIVDLGTFFAEPYCARLLSDLGADVIKVEALSGDDMRPLHDPFEGCQRGKRTIAINLKDPAGQEVVHRLTATADVVMHNFRPGKAELLGVGYQSLKAIKPDLIYCHMPGLGSAGPKSNLKAFAPLLSALAGTLFEGAGEGNPPVANVFGNEDYYNGFMGAVAVLLGLEHRDRTGIGQHIETPLLHAAMFATTHHMVDGSGRAHCGLHLDHERTGWGPLYRLYATADGWIAVACVGDASFERLVDALDLPVDPRFATSAGRADNSDALTEMLSKRFAIMTASDAFDTLDAAKVPCEVPLDHLHVPDYFWDEWALDTGRVFEQQHEVFGWVREIGLLTRLSEAPWVNKGPGPLFGEHTREVLEELGYASDAVAELLRSGVCLAVQET